ncbi:MAG TPA: phosphoserine phosphatase SerB [Terracidiphilus sp.]|jgi:phosphoserine phosphatase|nr:phosphoserine phosphatase SerB [Terracidiphilus sp.]
MTHAAHTQAFLIHFSGQDAPGIAAQLTAILAGYDVRILDIGQAQVHESLALAFLVELVEMSSDAQPAPLQAALQAQAKALGLQVRFKPVEHSSLEAWLHGPRPDRMVVTLLGPAITARQLARVTGIIAKHGMNIDRIERLSRRLAPEELSANASPSYACVELNLSGAEPEEAAMRAEFLAAAQYLSIDIAFQRESIFRRNRRLFAFDMDSTLIQGEVIDELAKMAGVGQQVAKITEAAMRGELDFDSSFTRRVGLLKGLPAERVHSLLNTIPLADGAERLLATLKLLGYHTVILSGGFNFFARSLQQRLGIDEIHANELEIVDGVVTGRVLPPVMNGARKAEILKLITQRKGFSLQQVVAVGDGANDLPMLGLAGMGIAYRAKPLVRAQACHSISSLGLDGLLYLIGVRDRDRDRDLSPHESALQKKCP